MDITITVNEADYQRLATAAQAAGKSVGDWLAQVGAQAAHTTPATMPDPLDLLEAAGLIAHRATHPHGPVDPERMKALEALRKSVRPGPPVEEILREMRSSR